MKKCFTIAPLIALALSAGITIASGNVNNNAKLEVYSLGTITPYAAQIDFDRVQYSKTALVTAGTLVGNQGCFSVEDLKGATWNATLEIGNLSTVGGAVISASAITITQTAGATPVTTLDGTSDTDEIVAIAHSNRTFTAGSPISVMQRTSAASNILGHYCIKPSFNITVPAYQTIGQYTATLTFTVLE